jgi:hypothetical protein
MATLANGYLDFQGVIIKQSATGFPNHYTSELLERAIKSALHPPQYLFLFYNQVGFSST